MTHQPLTKAEREELGRLHAEAELNKNGDWEVECDEAFRVACMDKMFRLLADLDAAEAERDRHKELIDAARYDVGERSFLEDAQNILKECVAPYSCEQMQAVAKALRQWRDKWAILLETVVRTCEDRDDLMAQRDRAESELDAERRMRVEAEAASDRLMAERDALKAQRDNLHARLYPQPCKGCPGCSSYADCPDEIDRLTTERDALKAKLADPRRVLIHETEVVATKEEIAKLKKELADLSEADEELHACRALVNATSENLSVDLERMVDDLAEANEKAARSEKDAHSWCELYTNTKAKLAALVEAAARVRIAEDVYEGSEDQSTDYQEVHRSTTDLWAMLDAAIAAARGGES